MIRGISVIRLIGMPLSSACLRISSSLWASGRSRNALLALEAVHENVGYLVCGLSIVEDDLARGRCVLPFPETQGLVAPLPYVSTVPGHVTARPQLQRFCDWLRAKAELTAKRLAGAAALPGAHEAPEEPQRLIGSPRRFCTGARRAKAAPLSHRGATREARQGEGARQGGR